MAAGSGDSGYCRHCQWQLQLPATAVSSQYRFAKGGAEGVARLPPADLAILNKIKDKVRRVVHGKPMNYSDPVHPTNQPYPYHTLVR